MTYINAHQTIANILATHEAKKESKPKQIGVKPGEAAKEGQIFGAAQNVFHYL